MTPKEKALELIKKFELRFDEFDDENYISMVGWDEAKQCALICVDECIKAVDECVDYPYYSDLHYTDWKEVKQEIEKL